MIARINTVQVIHVYLHQVQLCQSCQALPLPSILSNQEVSEFSLAIQLQSVLVLCNNSLIIIRIGSVLLAAYSGILFGFPIEGGSTPSTNQSHCCTFSEGVERFTSTSMFVFMFRVYNAYVRQQFEGQKSKKLVKIIILHKLV